MRDIRDMEAFAKSQNALEEIYAERRRQIDSEGWTEGHDDDHGNAQLARAAAAYALVSSGECYSDSLTRLKFREFARQVWPWDVAWWKPKDARRNLVRAAALIVAEIERIDRINAREMGGPT